MECYVWDVALYEQETRTTRKVEMKQLKRIVDKGEENYFLWRSNKQKGELIGPHHEKKKNKNRNKKNNGRGKLYILDYLKKARSYRALIDAAEERQHWRMEFRTVVYTCRKSELTKKICVNKKQKPKS